LLEASQRLGHPAVNKLQGSTANTAWEALESGGVSPDELSDIVRAAASLPAADLTEVGPQHEILLDGALAVRCGVVLLRVRDGRLEVACANPLLHHLEHDLESATGRRINLAVASPQQVRRPQEITYGARLGQADGAARRSFSRVMSDRRRAHPANRWSAVGMDA